MARIGDLVGKAKKYMDEHPDQVAKGLDTVGGLVDKGTKGRFSSQITKGRDLAKDKLVHGAGETGQRRTTNAHSPAGTPDEATQPTTGESFETRTVRPETDGRAPGQL